MYTIIYIFIFVIIVLLLIIYLTKNNIKEKYNWNMEGTSKMGSLDILNDLRTGTHPTDKALYVTKNTDSGIVEFRHSNGSEGIGFGVNQIYATGSWDGQKINIKPKNGGTNLYNTTYLRGPVYFNDNTIKYENKGSGFCTRYLRKIVFQTGGMLYVIRNQPGDGAILIKINAVGTIINYSGALVSGVIVFRTNSSATDAGINSWNNLVGNTNIVTLRTSVDSNVKKGGIYFEQNNQNLLIDMEVMIGGVATWDIDVWTDGNTIVI